jgi:MFS transporter, AAHS family, 4-hydroxybenzoate transporter
MGALLASRLVDKCGVIAIVVLYVLACPAVAVIGVIGNSVYLLSAAIFVAGFCLIGITLSMGAVVGMTYPTEIRAKGVGFATGIGRFCSMLSPVVGSWLIARGAANDAGLSLQQRRP